MAYPAAMLARVLALLSLVSCTSSGPTPHPAPTHPTQSRRPSAQGDSERIVFVRAGSVWIMRTDGQAIEQLTVRQLDAPDEAPALSPSGKKLAYIGSSEQERHLFLMDMELSEVTRLTEPPSLGAADPAWSPDGQWLAFMQGDPRDSMDLVRINATAPGEIELLMEGDDDEPAYVGAPAFSADGASIVFAADRRKGAGTTLWRLNLEAKTLTSLTPPAAGKYHVRDRDPVFTPDGKYVVFSSNRHTVSADHSDNFDLYRIGRDGSGLKRLTQQRGSAVHPTIVAKGKQIVYVRSADGKAQESQLYAISIDGGAPHPITGDAKAQDREPSAGRVF